MPKHYFKKVNPMKTVGCCGRLSGCLIIVLLAVIFDARAAEQRALRFYNTHTHERISVTYKQGGGYAPEALAQINHILRDHRSGDVYRIDAELLDFLYDLLQKLDYHDEVHIISGYRSPKTNATLRKKSSGVAAGSLHMQGKALDFRLPGVSTSKVRDAALAMKRGGVGYYQKLDFVHIDTGRVRRW